MRGTKQAVWLFFRIQVSQGVHHAFSTLNPIIQHRPGTDAGVGPHTFLLQWRTHCGSLIYNMCSIRCILSTSLFTMNAARAGICRPKQTYVHWHFSIRPQRANLLLRVLTSAFIRQKTFRRFYAVSSTTNPLLMLPLRRRFPWHRHSRRNCRRAFFQT